VDKTEANTPKTLEGVLHFFSETGTEGGHWAFQDAQYISFVDGQERWSYTGLHVLKDDDFLTIYDPANREKTVWSGKILLQSYNLFTQDARGFWIHADQVGIDRDVWAEYFFREYPAQLTKRK